MANTETNKIAFIDHVGRTIVGDVVTDNDQILKVSNPVILHWQVHQDKSIEVQTFPLFFMEFVDKDKRDTNVWTFSKKNIVTSDVVLDERITSQVGRVNTPSAQPQPASGEKPKVISIDDLD